MRIVGKLQEPEITFHASGEALLRGLKMVEEMNRISNADTGIPIGVYRFKSHEEADAHRTEAEANKMARLAMERSFR